MAPKFLVVWGSVLVCALQSSAGYGREKHSQGQSQLLTAAPALQTRLWHFQLLISLITGQSWPAGARPCRSSPADPQHWTVCSSFMGYTGTLLGSWFVTEEKRLWLHAEKWASNGESCAKGQQHWPALDCSTWEEVWTLNSFLCVLVPKKSAGREFNTD